MKARFVRLRDSYRVNSSVEIKITRVYFICWRQSSNIILRIFILIRQDTQLTFYLGSNQVDLVRVSGHNPEEANPIAVPYSPPVHLCDFVVATEPMPDLKQKKDNIIIYLKRFNI